MITLTISINEIWQPAESFVLASLRNLLPTFKILSVERPLFSGRYAVTIEGNEGKTDAELRQFFIFALSQGMGYEGEVVSIDRGAVSTAPGGIGQAVTDTAAAASPLLWPLAVGLGALALIIILPKLRG